VFASSARVLAGLVMPHTQLAARVFCDLTPQEADGGQHPAAADGPDGDVPAYEVWRRQIAAEFVAKERC